jgi:DDE superfamily endonuclease
VFEDVFSERVWDWVHVLVIGAILAPGQRTVASVLRVVGLSQERQYQNYHRVLNRARWSGHELSRRLLGLLVAAFVPGDAPIVVGLDDTIERRRGAKIAAKGLYRDPVRSSQRQVVKVLGLRWLSLQLLAAIPWAGRVWGLPFLTVLTPSERSTTARGRRYKTVTAWGWQAVCQVRRWLPDRLLVVVADGTFATYELLGGAARMARPVIVITRLRLDAALYEPPPPPQPGKRGPKPKKGARQPNLKARLADPATEWRPAAVAWYGGATKNLAVATGTALWHRAGRDPLPLRWVLLRDPAGKRPPTALCVTAPTAAPEQIVAWFVARWQIEVTFAEARAHLGIEAQRQWRPRAIGRTTPCLLGLFSLVVLMAQVLHPERLPTRQAAWYAKEEATFADALAAVRAHLRARWQYAASAADPDLVLIPRSLWTSLTDLLAYAA